jgi:PEP-CTERM motif
MRAIVATLAALFALAGSRQAEAAPITYFESLTTDGVLGGTAFTNELVTLSFTANISTVTFFQGSNFTQYTNIPLVSTVTVAGVGSATFSDPLSLSVFDFPTFSEFSVTDTALSTDILDTFAVTSGFAGYDMTTPLSPVSGGAAYPIGTLFPTSVGSFEFTKTGGAVSTVSAVPEPSSLFLIALGLSGVAVHRTRRHVRGRS